MSENGKDVALPEQRKAAVEYGLQQYNHMAAERDRLDDEVRELRTQIAGYKVALEANASRIAELESRTNSAMLIRDEKVEEAARLKGVLASIKAVLNADTAHEHFKQSAQQQIAQQIDPYRKHTMAQFDPRNPLPRVPDTAGGA